LANPATLSGVRRRIRSALGAVAVLCALAAAVAPAAGAIQWEVTQLNEQPRLYGISCPTPAFCLATGSSGALVSSTDPTGGAAAWSLAYPGSTEPAGSGEFNGAQARGASCPSTDACVAVSLTGLIYSSTDPAGPASAWSVSDVSPKGPNTHMYGVSCPTPSLCAAVAFGGRIVTSTKPFAGSPEWKTAELPEALQLSGISCPGPSLCVAVSRDGRIVSSTDPTGGAAAWKTVAQPGFGTLYGVACPSTSLCVTADDHDFFATANPNGEAAEWTTESGVTPLQVTALSCASTAACAAVDNNADVFTSAEPAAGPGAWSFVNAIPYTASNGVFGVSCPTRSFCAMGAAQGRVAFSTDPFGDESTPAKLSPGKHQRRPTVKLTGHPRRRVAIDAGRRARVRFRFREIGVRHAGFLCGLDRGRFGRCRSPKAYSVGPGRHAFRVKVFDPGGFDQTVTRFRFRVLPSGR
jgi:hypothetical protein